MKAKPMRLTTTGNVPCEPEIATHIWLRLPGPSGYICLPVVLGNATRRGTKCWSWNGDTEKPTLKPSIRTTPAGGVGYLCHSWVNGGKVQFLSDCSHEHANTTMDLLDVEL